MNPSAARVRKPKPPLDRAALEQLALAYVGRFATSRGKLVAYLGRKLRERGWEDGDDPDPTGIAERMAELGYVDDRAFADGRARSFEARGLGPRRLSQALHQAGIDEETARETLDGAGEGEVRAALRFAQRKRIGPFATVLPDPKERERRLAAFVRAGHRFALARAISAMGPGDSIDEEQLREAR